MRPTSAETTQESFIRADSCMPSAIMTGGLQKCKSASRQMTRLCNRLHTEDCVAQQWDFLWTLRRKSDNRRSRFINGSPPASPCYCPIARNSVVRLPERRSQRMAHDVFISYASEDKIVADAVCARLE